MDDAKRSHRTSPAAHTGRARAAVLSVRLGVALREARLAGGLTQRQLAIRGGLSQARVSEIERGAGSAVGLETWCVLAAAAGESLVAFLEHAPGADRPRDIEHVRRQSALVDIARGGGWTALPELALDHGAIRSRSVDVALLRRQRREAVVVEVWDWFDDVGAALRGLDGKVAALDLRLTGDSGPSPERDRWRSRGVFVVRETRRNRALVDELRPLFAARFPGSSVGWLRSITEAGHAMPSGDGLLWSDANGRLIASRLGGRARHDRDGPARRLAR